MTDRDDLLAIASDLESHAVRLREIAGGAPPPPPPPPPPPAAKGIWTSAQELAGLAMSGKAWEALLNWDAAPPGVPNVSNQDDNQSVSVLAKALTYARIGGESRRIAVQMMCDEAVGTEKGARALALGREVIAYVLAADLVGYRATHFAAWVDTVRRAPCIGGPVSMIASHEERPNNWGTHAGASRAACAAYLDDKAELARCAKVFKGWLGDRASYSGFTYGDLAWQADPSTPVGVNPKGATRAGHSVDGVLPDDQRRAGGFVWPPPKENYVWEALQGAYAQALVLSRAGFPGVWDWSDRALLRAVAWLHEQANFPAAGDDTWIPHLVNWAYGTTFPAPIPSAPGKNVGFTDWTHQGRR